MKLFRFLALMLITVMMSGCSSSSERTYVPNEENVKILGRAYSIDDSLWLSYSGSGAEFSFNGTKAEITIKGDDNAASENNEDNQSRIAIYLNDERVVDDMIDSAEKSYTVFESDEAEDVTVKIVKLSETANSTCGISAITVNSKEGIKATENKDMLIEFIGDSITCGYGVDDEVKENHFSTTTEDVTKTYAYKTAELLNADYSMVAISGHGVISGYSDGKKKSAGQVMTKYYDKLGSCYGTYNGMSAQKTDWNFSRLPDVIVINLGTNDDSYTLNHEDRQQEFCDKYVEFIGQVRSKNPDAHIICTLGVMGDRLYPYVELAVETYKSETGDEKVYSLQLDVQSAADGYAADWHPTEATHTKTAAKLAEKIRSIIQV